ncbi:MAG: hypothetical protein N2645_15155 [Clostridia bacterium]|nr:hypothetical protein [Clostridia bacterium]
MNDDLKQIINLILIESRNILKELRDSSKEMDVSFYGHPPKSAIVKYHDYFDENGFKIGNILAAWKITLDDIVCIEDLTLEPTTQPVDRMYYKEGRMLFAIDIWKEKIVLEWQVGPRYGRGFTYNIETSAIGINIIRDKILWVS